VVQLARLLPDIRFRIVGIGEEEERLHASGRHLANLEFLGYRSGKDLDELYRGAIAVLIPSRWEEVFGLTALEAMRAGKPVVASTVGGLPEIVGDRVSGFLVHPLDIRGWAEAVLRLVHDDALRKRLGREGRSVLERKFSVREHDARLKELYAEAMRG
jgi:glycosyltransferase involved in cell wall biosynthesis